MESILEFWRRAFRRPDNFRACEIIRDKMVRVHRPIPLHFGKGFPGAPDLLPAQTLVYVEQVSTQAVAGCPIAFFDIEGRRIAAVSRGDGRTVFHFDPEESIRAMLTESYGPVHRPIASRCPFHYHRVPGGIRFAVGRTATMLSGRSLGEGFPPWPIADGVEALRRCVLLCATENTPDMDAVQFWPEGKTWALALSHDVDSAEGSRNIPKFLDVESRFAFHSTWSFPARRYKLDVRLLGDLVRTGHEAACHGYNHDCKLAFLDRRIMADRLRRSVEVLGRFGVKGFRSPALGRSPALFEELKTHFFYDSSIPDTEEGAGCCTVFPFTVGGLTELPITLPMDATLLLHGFRPRQILDLWKKKLSWIERMHGLAVLVTHPEGHFSGNRGMLNVYAELLDVLSTESSCWIATLGEIAEWWARSATLPH